MNVFGHGRLPSSPGSRFDSQEWTDDLPVCNQSGTGLSINQIYKEGSATTLKEHEYEDRSFRVSMENIYLYGVFDGHDGDAASSFAAKRIPADLLFGQLENANDDQKIKEIMHQAFLSMEKGFFESIDDYLAEKAQLQLQLPENLSPFELYEKFPEQYKRFEELEQRIAGGTTVCIALIVNDKLYIANVGSCRALLCETGADGRPHIEQLTMDHTLHNPQELQRMGSVGVDTETLSSIGKIADHNYTRIIGNYNLKANYKELDALSNATDGPIIAEPEIIGGIPLTSAHKFLLIMSDGLYRSLADARPEIDVNTEIASMVIKQFQQQTTLSGVAQAVVDQVVRIHHDEYISHFTPSCQKRDDITLLIRKFNQTLPAAEREHNMLSNNTMVNPIPLSVEIPEGSENFIPTNDVLSTYQMDSFNPSSNDSSGDESSSFRFGTRKQAKKIELPLDKDGKIKAYVDFSEYFDALKAMSEEDIKELEDDLEPKPQYPAIPEEEGRSSEASSPATTPSQQNRPIADNGDALSDSNKDSAQGLKISEV